MQNIKIVEEKERKESRERHLSCGENKLHFLEW
jgi:hypothetical protein